MLPVDIAGTAMTNTQAAMELSQKSQIEGAYAANLASQGQTAEVAYSSPVTTSSVDVLPPQVLDSTPIAYQQAELNAPKSSLESQMSSQVGDLNNSFNFNATQGPPTGAFAISRDAAPDGNQYVVSAPQFTTAADAAAAGASVDQKVLPVDIAGTAMTNTQAAMELSQKSQIEGAYAANSNSQGNTAEVAYSSPVTTSSVDVLPPQVLDSTPIAYQQAELNAPKSSLESQMSNQVGDLNNSFNYNATQGPPTGAFSISREAAPDSNQYAVAAPQFTTSNDAAATPDQKVLPVDIAGTAMTDTRAAMELSQKSQIEGAYAANLASQGNTAEVAYSSPVVTRDAAAPDQTYVSHSGDYDASTVVNDNDQTIVNHGGVVANPQVTQGPEVRANTPEYGKPRTESIAQVASAAAIAANAQQHLIGEPRFNQVPPVPGAPKRGLGTIFSDITMGKKSVKPTNPLNPKVDPSAQAKASVVGQPTDANKAGVKPVEPTSMMGRMRDSVDGETTMPISTNQSLERQMLDASNHVQSMPASTLGAILGKTNASAPQKPNEYLTNALVDYHTVVGLVREGKTNEAALVAGNASPTSHVARARSLNCFHLYELLSSSSIKGA